MVSAKCPSSEDDYSLNSNIAEVNETNEPVGKENLIMDNANWSRHLNRSTIMNKPLSTFSNCEFTISAHIL